MWILSNLEVVILNVKAFDRGSLGLVDRSPTAVCFREQRMDVFLSFFLFAWNRVCVRGRGKPDNCTFNPPPYPYEQRVTSSKGTLFPRYYLDAKCTKCSRHRNIFTHRQYLLKLKEICFAKSFLSSWLFQNCIF